MKSLESVRKYLQTSLRISSTYRERRKMQLIHSDLRSFKEVHDAFFNLVADPNLSPEDIVLKLETYTNSLDGFSTNRPIQSLVAHACLESLASRKPKVFSVSGSWEKLLWIVVKYSSFTSNEQRNVSQSFKKTNKDTVYWITKMVTQKSCPNPCLRLEFFRFIRRFDCDHVQIDRKSFRDNLIITLLELADNYTSLTLDQLPNFCPLDLQQLMFDNNISMEYLMKDSDLYMKKSKIIAALLKLTRLFALLEKEKQLLDPTLLYVDITHQLGACTSFCGLIPPMPFVLQEDRDKQECVLCFIKDVSNNPVLMNYLVDTLDTVSQVSEYDFDDDELEDEVKIENSMFFRGFIKHFTKLLPKNKFHQEIYGGNAPAKEYFLRFMQNNMVDTYNDADNDSSPDEDDSRNVRSQFLRDFHQYLMENGTGSNSGSYVSSAESDNSSFVSDEWEDLSGEEEIISDE